MAIYDSFKLAYFLLNDRFLYIWAALISKNFIFRQITGHKIENHAICNIYFLHIK